MILDALRSVKQEVNNFRRRRRVEPWVYESSPLNDSLSKSLLSKGYAVYEDFWSKDQCLEAIEAIDEFIDTSPEKIWVDDNQSDHRIFGGEKLSPVIEEFWISSFIRNILAKYVKPTAFEGFTLAARLVAKEGNPGSGGGWHRDTAGDKQVKAILYLTDCTIENGPFQFIQNSHKISSIVKHQLKYNFKLNQTRFTDQELNKLIRDEGEADTLTAKAGTLILVDTRGLHRGMPIDKNCRYALTNYYWHNSKVPSHIKKLIIDA